MNKQEIRKNDMSGMAEFWLKDTLENMGFYGHIRKIEKLNSNSRNAEFRITTDGMVTSMDIEYLKGSGFGLLAMAPSENTTMHVYVEVIVQ
jgi:hypothetical protein